MKSEQIFFVQPKAHQFKFADLNKTAPTEPLKLFAFFKQCQATNKAAGVLEENCQGQEAARGKENGSSSCRTLP
jgi:hypothetical protein